MSKPRFPKRFLSIVIVGALVALAASFTLAHGQELTNTSIQTLPLNKIVQASARADQSSYSFTFHTNTDGNFFLLIDSTTLNDGPSFVVKDVTHQETVGIFRTSVTGACLQLDMAEGDYQLTVTPGRSADQQDYHLLLWQQPVSNLDCPVSMLAGIPQIAADGASPWQATTKGLQPVNLREAPSITSPIVTVLDPDTGASIIGMTSDARWLAIKLDYTTAWVASNVVMSTGKGWSGLPVLNVPNYVPNVVSDNNASDVLANNGSNAVNSNGNAATVNVGTGGSNGNNGNGGGGSNNPVPTAVPVVPTSVPVVPTSVPAVPDTSANVSANVNLGNTTVGVSVNTAPVTEVLNNTLNTVGCVAGSLLGGSC